MSVHQSKTLLHDVVTCNKSATNFMRVLLLSDIYPLLGHARFRGRCWAAIRLSRRTETSGRPVHEVDGLDIGGQHGRRFVLLRHTHRPQRREHCGTKQEGSILQLNTPGLGWLFATLLLQHPNQNHKTARSATRNVSFLRSDSRCRWYVNDLSNVTPRCLPRSRRAGFRCWCWLSVHAWITCCWDGRLSTPFL